MNYGMLIVENLADIKNHIAAAAKRRERDPASIKLIAVSKTKPVEQILEAVSAGQLIFGENYAQELRDKSKQISENLDTYALTHLRTAVEWHFIGHLQKNKLKYVLPVAKWIHTIDSVELLNALSSRLQVTTSSSQIQDVMTCRRDDVVNCLIEVNIANEQNKSGISPEKVFSLVSAFTQTLKHSNTQTLVLKGLMCMAPNRPYFRQLKSLLDEINSRSIYPEKLTELSMGMTQDFEVAIEEGATMVRIGTAIFGERSA